MSLNYSKPFLKNVVFQANYSIHALKLHLDSSLKDLCQQITGNPVQETKNRNVSINLNANQPTVSENSRWLFKGTTIHIIIQHDLIQIINLKYTNYSDFHKNIEEVFNLLKHVYDPSFLRIALRYVNVISFDDGSTFDFKDLINPDLLNGLIKFQDKGLQRSIGQVAMKDSESDISTIFTYGFNNSLFPNLISKREFLLDYDCFISYPKAEKNVSISDTLLQIRNNVNELFEKSIENGLREKIQ